MKNQVEIAQRTLALGMIGVRFQAEDMIATVPSPPEAARDYGERVRKWTDKSGITQWLSPIEMQLHQRPLGAWVEDEITALSWRAESLSALLWTLHCIPIMPSYFRARDVNETFEHIRVNATKEFFDRIQLRPADELEAEWELARYFHWRCRTEFLRLEGWGAPDGDSYEAVVARSLVGRDEVDHDGVDMLVDGNRFVDLPTAQKYLIRSIAYERHLAFNWIFLDGDWDDTTADT